MAAKMVRVVAVVACVATLSTMCAANRDNTGCPISFQGKCRCGPAFSIYDNHKEKKMTVNCTNTGFTDVTMLHDLPEDTQVLIFTGNSIPSLPTNVLDNNKNYDFIDVIDMSNNHIKFISGRSFHKVYSVKTFILNHNDLEITDGKKRPRVFSNFENLESLHLTNAFSEGVDASDNLLSLDDIFFESELIYLKILHLEQNEIWSVGDSQQVFCELTKLEQIHLGDNRLMDMDFQIDCLKFLRYIDLERNMIPRLSEDGMQKLDAFKNKQGEKLRVNLKQNPFSCDCRSKEFVSWLNTTKIDLSMKEDLRCHDGSSADLIGKTLTSVKKFECAEEPVHKHTHDHDHDYDHDYHDYDYHDYHDHPHPPHHPHGYSSATIGALSFFLVFTSSILLAVAYFHREKLKNIAYPYWDYLTRKIGYSGIASDEAPQEVNV